MSEFTLLGGQCPKCLKQKVNCICDSKFKVGDWVIENTSLPFCLREWHFEWKNSNFFNKLQLWQPKVGEWCWFKTDKSFKLVKYNTPTFNQAYYHGLNPIVEPFIGELPSWLKETK